MKAARVWPAMLALLVAASPFVETAQAEPDLSGDVRVRYENTHNQRPGSEPLEARHRMVARFRLGMTGKINDLVTWGARMTTGDPDDPNSTDVTLGSFVNDLTLSLDRAHVGIDYKGASGVAGKFANPLMTTELVWDGDVNPQGVGAAYSRKLTSALSGKAVGLFGIVDEQAVSSIPDSDMFGVQGQLNANPASGKFSAALAASYVDYEIKSLLSGNAGDFLSNAVVIDTLAGVPTRRYASDFDMLDLYAVVDLNTSSARFPVRVVGDFVKNFGAVTGDDQGFGVDAFVGPLKKRNDVRFRYGYSEVGQDAVLAAFSHDNTTIPTNYRQHTLTVDYMVVDSAFLNATYYYYQFKDRTPTMSDEWVSRLRLNCELRF
jgi:hypothetical protein